MGANTKQKDSTSSAFSLIEFLIYIAIFAVSSTFLVAILSAVTRVQVRQASTGEVNDQLQFLQHTIRRLVQQSSIIDMPAGVPASSLMLRMASSAQDPTQVYVSGAIVYIQEGIGEPVALTDAKVTVDMFVVTKTENPGGNAVVHIDIAVSHNTTNPRAQFKRTVRTAITRVSAATFDSDIVPNTSAFLNIGNPTSQWNNAHFAGKVGIGTTLPAAPAKLKLNGDITFSDSTSGLILVSPGGTCFRLGISNGGSITTSTVNCP